MVPERAGRMFYMHNTAAIPSIVAGEMNKVFFFGIVDQPYFN